MQIDLKKQFSPVTITLDSKEEVKDFLSIINLGVDKHDENGGYITFIDEPAKSMAISLSRFLVNNTN